MINNIKIGEIGENIATGYLIKKGWNMIARNHKNRRDEIDIIGMTEDKTLVFVEVKTLLIDRLSTFDALRPEDNLSGAKLHKITRACEFFARQYPELIDQNRGWRIDLVAIDLSTNLKAKDIRHYENI
jgi:putative endonuclease